MGLAKFGFQNVESGQTDLFTQLKTVERFNQSDPIPQSRAHRSLPHHHSNPFPFFNKYSEQRNDTVSNQTASRIENNRRIDTEELELTASAGSSVEYGADAIVRSKRDLWEKRRRRRHPTPMFMVHPPRKAPHSVDRYKAAMDNVDRLVMNAGKKFKRKRAREFHDSDVDDVDYRLGMAEGSMEGALKGMDEAMDRRLHNLARHISSMELSMAGPHSDFSDRTDDGRV